MQVHPICATKVKMFVRLYFQEVTTPLWWITATRRFSMDTKRLNVPLEIFLIPSVDNPSTVVCCEDEAGPLSS